jgi:hypothetical protein
MVQVAGSSRLLDIIALCQTSYEITWPCLRLIYKIQLEFTSGGAGVALSKNRILKRIIPRIKTILFCTKIVHKSIKIVNNQIRLGVIQ